MNLAQFQKLFYEMIWVLPTLCFQILCLFLAVKGLKVRRKAAVFSVCSFSLFTVNTLLIPVFFTWRGSIFKEMYSKNIFSLTPQLFFYDFIRALLSLGSWLLLALALRQLFMKSDHGTPAA